MGWGNKKYVGLIAQEVENVVPEMVSNIGKIKGINNFKEVDPNEIIYMLVNSIKELKKENNELNARLEKLEK